MQVSLHFEGIFAAKCEEEGHELLRRPLVLVHLSEADASHGRMDQRRLYKNTCRQEPRLEFFKAEESFVSIIPLVKDLHGIDRGYGFRELDESPRVPNGVPIRQLLKWNHERLRRDIRGWVLKCGGLRRAFGC